mmetsp:Transcript_105/g.189  ORF Transcript_105/g.189 Transcript_105/m.189 type:complete len:1079 (+) Transcript_105:193-3429(+)|eukprot:CAMPEP_0185031384 /NCGR_PEP_ID=MMETSP1103-20130426/18829_1 /TAXON_ID=36769 /ORGANISM="Paraphysomonas bandaiensis, Strain Caron Lab Isolate" /LENGTH=1078 /DNA_ID=CAMNT_0027566897 /DNA_START=121 /DNA_END=3357 /DNA_ORIENTATION=-
MASSSVIEVVFKVQANTRFGEEIRLSGNLPSLGCDDIDRAVPLVTSPTEFPWWYNKEAIFVPENYLSVKYRYLVFSGGKFVRYEGGGQLIRSLNLEHSDDATKSTSDILDKDPSRGLSDIPQRTSINVHAYAKEIRTRKFADVGRKSHDSIRASDSVLVVSYFLPVVVKKDSKGRWTAEWNNENILSFETRLRVSWVGTINTTETITSEDEETLAAVLRLINCFPIFVGKDMHKKFYDVFCKQHLWPILHHNGDVYGPVGLNGLDHQNEKNLWFTYTTVNNLFRTKVVEVYHEGDLIWVHGFHLMLLPSFLRRRIQRARIGIFLHTPFPSSEIWKTLWCREEILQGILSADQVGFHLYEYARHFLTTCRRVLGTHYEFDASGSLIVETGGRKICITCMHVGVDHRHITHAVSRGDFVPEVMSWQKKFSGKTVITGIDRLERLKCIPLKLVTIEHFIKENPGYFGRVVFVIIGITAPERGSDYLQTQRDVTCLVNRINREYPGLIYYEERKESQMKLFQRLSLFCVSDILMVTSARDGLNRLPVEYTLARSIARKHLEETANNIFEGPDADTREGIVIISEFVSTARVMRGALIVNPWKTDEVQDALRRALTMDANEHGSRFRRSLEFCNRITTVKWAETVLQDLKQVEKSVDNSNHSTLGLGINYRVSGVKAGFNPLDVVKVSKAYRSSRQRLILLDWGGTLVDVLDNYEAYAVATGHATRGGPSMELVEVLEDLCMDTRNHVFVISGKDIYSMQEFFGEIEGLGLAAEHGCYFRYPKHSAYTGHRHKWQTMISLEDTSWMDAVRRVMDIYTQRTHGAYIEQKGSAIIWQFRDADPEFGFMQSKELEEHLTEIISSRPLEVIRGGGIDDGYIEIRPEGLSKGLFLTHALSALKSMGSYVDFVMTVGDDITDEAMFEATNRLEVASKKGGNPMKCYSVAVGKKYTEAKFYVNDCDAVMELLQSLTRATSYERKYHSALDLSNHGAEEDITSRRSRKLESSPLLAHLRSNMSNMPRSNSESRVNTLPKGPDALKHPEGHPLEFPSQSSPVGHRRSTTTTVASIDEEKSDYQYDEYDGISF